MLHRAAVPKASRASASALHVHRGPVGAGRNIPWIWSDRGGRKPNIKRKKNPVWVVIASKMQSPELGGSREPPELGGAGLSMAGLGPCLISTQLSS